MLCLVVDKYSGCWSWECFVLPGIFPFGFYCCFFSVVVSAPNFFFFLAVVVGFSARFVLSIHGFILLLLSDFHFHKLCCCCCCSCLVFSVLLALAGVHTHTFCSWIIFLVISTASLIALLRAFSSKPIVLIR